MDAVPYYFWAAILNFFLCLLCLAGGHKKVIPRADQIDLVGRVFCV